MSAKLARVTGTVLSVPPAFKGVSTVSGKPFIIEGVNVLVQNADVTKINHNRESDGKITGLDVRDFTIGETLDVLVECDVYRNEPQFRLVSLWTPSEEETLASAARLEGVLTS